MGVNWQQNDTYQYLKDLKKTTGLSYAEHNALNNPYGNHSFGGLLISQLLPQLVSGGAQLLSNHIHGSEPDSEDYDVGGRTSILKDYNKALRGYNSATTDEDKKKFAKQLQQLAKDNPDNRTIANGYNRIKAEVENLLK